MSEPGDKQVVVLAGGRATRLRGLGGDLPKALRPVGGRPFLDVMLEPLLRRGFRRFHFCLGRGAGQLARHLAGLDPALEVTAAVETVPCGTAGALWQSRPYLDDTFLLAMGDTYFEFDYAPLFEALAAGAEGLLVATSAGAGVTPNVGLAGPLVTAYDKAGVRDGWTDTGVAVLRRRSLDLLAGARPPVDLSALFLRLAAGRSLHALRTDRGFHDIGTPARYRAFDARLAAGAPGGALAC